MSDGRKNNGGKRKGAGRKPKSSEEELIERLSPLDDLAFKKLEEGVREGNFRFIQLFMAYRYGRPKETKDIKLGGDLTFGQIDFFKSEDK